LFETGPSGCERAAHVTVSPTRIHPPASRWLNAVFLLVALALPLVWMPIFERGMGDRGLCDEPGHMGAIYTIAEHQPLPAELTMLPGYHFLVNALARHHPTMTLAREVSAGFGLLGIVIFAFAWRRLHGRPAGAATLLFALLPILQHRHGLYRIGGGRPPAGGLVGA
jgi:hypothetical protein